MRVVLLTTGIAVWVAGLAMLTLDLSMYRKSLAAELSNEANILSLSTASALAFDDHAVAERNLSALQARPEMLEAALYSANGTLYASYARPGEAAAPARPPPAGLRMNGERIEIAHQVALNGEILGTIYLRARYALGARAAGYLGIFVLVTLLALAVAFLFSSGLQQRISEPLDAMAGVAREIVNRRDYSLRARKISDDEIGVVVDAFNNMLEEVEARSQALSVATARLESTMAAAEIGGWLWDVRSNEFTADRNLATLYGLNDESELNGDPRRHHERIHPDDLASVTEAETNALRTGVLASTEFRVRLPSGGERWMARRGKVQLDADGRALFISGLLIDITAQKRAEQAARASEKLYRAIGESIDYGVWVCDRDGRFVYASESFLRLLGMTQEEFTNRGWAGVLHPDEADATLSAWAGCIASGNAWYREQRMRGVDGRYHPILAQGVPIRGETGEVSGWAGINLDISRLKRTEEALREADRRKDEFLATLAHELRNPLAPIRHAVKVLESGNVEDGQRQWCREVISRQVQRMALLLDDLLDVSRITRGRLDIKVERVDLNALVGAAVETARPLIDSKHHRLVVELPAHPITLLVDPLRLSQSLSNLLTNAAKYTDPHGKIALTVALNPEEITLSVQDNGIGFEQHALSNMFQMFSQVDSAIDRAEGGLGIGLALVDGLIALHGGRVDGFSAGPGCGSAFIIHLPRSVVVEASLVEPTSEPPPAQASSSALKVLVADDNRDAADSLAMVLELNGYQVLVAHTGKEALFTGRQGRPQAVILDIGMPDMTGYEVARAIRREPWGAGVLLLAITGWGQLEDKARAAEAGFDHHLTKPVDADEVESLLREYCRHFAAQRG
jgi:PAS domain S-box-containing protein